MLIAVFDSVSQLGFPFSHLILSAPDALQLMCGALYSYTPDNLTHLLARSDSIL